MSIPIERPSLGTSALFFVPNDMLGGNSIINVGIKKLNGFIIIKSVIKSKNTEIFVNKSPVLIEGLVELLVSVSKG